MNLKNSAAFSFIFLFLALANNGKHLFLAYEMIHPATGWEMWTAVLSVIVVEGSVLKFTLKGEKMLALYFAVATGLIALVYLISNAYDAQYTLVKATQLWGGFTATFWRETIIAVVWSITYAAVPYFFSEFIATEIVAIDDREELKKEISRLTIYENTSKLYEQLNVKHDEVMRIYEPLQSNYDTLLKTEKELRELYDNLREKYESDKREYEEAMTIYESEKLVYENDKKELIKLRAENVVLKGVQTILDRHKKALSVFNNTYIYRGKEFYKIEINPNTQQVSLVQFNSNEPNKPKHLIDNVPAPPLSNGASKNIPKELIFDGA